MIGTVLVKQNTHTPLVTFLDATRGNIDFAMHSRSSALDNTHAYFVHAHLHGKRKNNNVVCSPSRHSATSTSKHSPLPLHEVGV